MVGLPAAAVALMAGLVLLANAGWYGFAGVASGLFLVVAGAGVAITLFRSPDGHPTSREAGGVRPGDASDPHAPAEEKSSR